MFVIFLCSVVVIFYFHATDIIHGIGFSFSGEIAVPLPLCPGPNDSHTRPEKSVYQQTDPCVLCRGRSTTDGRWYDFSVKSFRFFVYSAFYDDRPSLLSSLPVIRIVAITDDVSQRTPMGLFCLLHHRSGKTRVPLEDTPRACGPGWSLNGKGANPYVYTCPTVSGIKPHALTIIGLGVSNSSVTLCMPVEYPPKPDHPRDFVICVPVAFGDLDPYRVIEWTEMQRILGVSLITVYDLSIGEAGRQVLRHYANEQFVDLRKTDYIYRREDNHNVLQSAIVLNDCLYRHMYSFRWIIVNDVDEFIKPMRHDSLRGLVDYLDATIPSKNSTASVNYAIRNSYFFLELEPDVNVSSHLTFLRFRKRAPVSGLWHRVKPIISTMSCTHLFNHLCLGATAKYSTRALVESVDPSVALTQHYRLCPLEKSECVEAMANSTQDDCMLVFAGILKDKVAHKVQAIMGHLPNNWT